MVDEVLDDFESNAMKGGIHICMLMTSIYIGQDALILLCMGSLNTGQQHLVRWLAAQRSL